VARRTTLVRPVLSGQPPEDDRQANQGCGDDPQGLSRRGRIFRGDVSLAMRTAGRILQDFTPAIRAGNRCLVSGIITAADVVIPVVVAIIIVVAVGCHGEPPCFRHCREQSTLRSPRGRPVVGHSPASPHGTLPCRPDSGSRSCSPSWPASPCCWRSQRAENRNRRRPGEARSSHPRPHRYRRDPAGIPDRRQSATGASTLETSTQPPGFPLGVLRLILSR
jgi:hypothetical protein